MRNGGHQMISRMKQWHRDQRGITGLETAIILIAFVVVSSVFAFTVLSAGVFSAQKGQEAIHSGLESARSSMELVGPVVGEDTNDDDNVDEIVFIIGNTLEGEAINFTTTTDSDNDGDLSDETTRNHTTIATFTDEVQTVGDITWTKTAVGKGDGDDLLEPGEKFEITIKIHKLATSIVAYDEFTIELKPANGAAMTLSRTIPANVDKVMDLE